MTAQTPLIPRQPVPSLDLPLAGGGRFVLADESPENFTLIVFYRGLHCPICSNYLGDLASKASDFAERGTSIVTVSTDGADRAEKAKEEWKLGDLRVAYDLDLDKAREWGLYISTSRGKTSIGIEEPALFAEPGLFLVRPDKTLYFGSVQTMPFARPSFDGVLMGLDFVLKTDYPARGHVVDHRQAAA